MNRFDYLLFKEQEERNEIQEPNYDEILFCKYKKDIIILVERLLREGKDVTDVPTEIVNPFHSFLCEAVYFIDSKKRETETETETVLECIPENETLNISINPVDYRYITIRDKFYTIERFLSKNNIET